MWMIAAIGSAFFSGLTSILAKCGIQKTDSSVATGIRTVVILFFSWIMVFLVGSQSTISELSAKTWVFLILSGLATGASWLCYFRALQLGNINKVVPIDKSSTILTMLLAMVFLHEGITWMSGAAMLLIAAGTFLMIQKKEISNPIPERKTWLFYAVLSAVFASLTSILGKIGIENVESNLGTAIRTGVVLGSWHGLSYSLPESGIKFGRFPKRNWVLSVYLELQQVERGCVTIKHYRMDWPV